MKASVSCLGSILFSLALVSPRAQGQFEHPDLKSGKVVVHKLLILPPQVGITKSGMKGNEGMPEEEGVVENALPSLISKALQAKGCAVFDDVVTPAALSKNEELKSSVADIWGKFKTIEPHVAQKPKDIRTGRYTMGDDVANFAPGAAVDALVFAVAEGRLTTGGKKTFDALVAGPGGREDFIVMNIYLVDSQSGNVLLLTDAAAGGNFVADPSHMAKPIGKSFKDFACSQSSTKPK
jgi:hypothetical protein